MYHYLILVFMALVPFVTKQNYKIVKYINTVTSVYDIMIYRTAEFVFLTVTLLESL
jgi:hypothetical protein